MTDAALGAVQLVVGLIRDEARLLGDVADDARFIVDEIECMSSHLRYLVDMGMGTGNHQVRTWTKQVMEFALDSKERVDEYLRASPAGNQGAGLLGHLRRGKEMFHRHRVATEMQKLKVRARDIAERLQRYDVNIQSRNQEPLVTDNTPAFGQSGPQDASDRTIVTGPNMLTKGTEELIRWLKETDHEAQRWPRVIAIVDGVHGDALAKQVYSHSSEEKLFELKASITIQYPLRPNEVLLDMLRQYLGLFFLAKKKYLGLFGSASADVAGTLDKLPAYVKGKKLLLVISGLDYPEIWDQIDRALQKFECSAGSAIVFSTRVKEVVKQCSPTKTLSFADFRRQSIIQGILESCNLDVNCADMFRSALSSNRTEKDLINLKSQLDPDLINLESPLESKQQDVMIAFCYKGLPKKYKMCLWYSTFCTPRSNEVRRASLIRRWNAEGLIEDPLNAFDALITQKLLLPLELGDTGKIKTCSVNPSAICEINKEIPTLEDLVLTDQLPINWNILFSLRNGFQLHQSDSMMAQQKKKSMVNSMTAKQKKRVMKQQKKIMMEFFKSLRTSSSSHVLSVLDLEGNKDHKNHDLYKMYKIRGLKYLILRNTNVTELPPGIKELESLETLDIRETRVETLNVDLPKLKHLLAGCVDRPSKEATVKYKESFSTVCMPRDVAGMQELEILSHVKVSDSAKELIDVGEKLKKLRKLGVVLSGTKAKLEDLFYQIDKYNIALRSLSVRMEQPGNWDAVDSTSMTLPGHLENLNICGIRGGLPHQIKELHKLTKITLCDTLLKEDALGILGVLRGLSCLRLHYHSFAEGALIFENEQFICLRQLVVDDDILTRITFARQTAPELSKMVWSFTRMKFISGVQNLQKLRSLQLNGGTCDPVGLEELRGHIAARGDDINFKLNLSENGQGSEQPGTAR